MSRVRECDEPIVIQEQDREIQYRCGFKTRDPSGKCPKHRPARRAIGPVHLAPVLGKVNLQ